MDNKEIVKYFYEVIVTENQLDEFGRYISQNCTQNEDKSYVISEFIMRGTHKGEFIGITPTNKVIEITGINIDKILDGKIVEHSGVARTFEAFFENGLIKTV